MAASSTARRSSGLNRTPVILPFLSPLGIFGLPTFIFVKQKSLALNLFLLNIKSIRFNHGQEVFGTEVAWEGDVEVFNVIGYPTAKQCFAWGAER
jgi:hypothetical protein